MGKLQIAVSVVGVTLYHLLNFFIAIRKKFSFSPGL